MADGTRWLSKEEQAAWRTFINATSNALQDIEADLKQQSGLTFSDYEVLTLLSEAHCHRLRMIELSRRLLHSRSRLTQRIDRMAKRGLVERQDCPEDRRGTWAVLTPAGYAAIEAAAPDHVKSVRRNLIDRYDAAELATLQTLMERLSDRPTDM